MHPLSTSSPSLRGSLSSLHLFSLFPSSFLLILSLILTHSLHSTLSTIPTFFFIFYSIMKSQVQDRFHGFYHTWFSKLEEILHHLLHLSKLRTQMLAALNDNDDVVNVQHLVNTTTSHIKQYYTVKWAEAREDVLPFFSPTWLTPLENACSWITGWKPSMVFRLLRSVVAATASFGMSEEQARKIEELRMRMRMEEEKVERDMERLQVAMADHKMVELAKLSSRAAGSGGGGVAEVAAVKGVLDGLERTMKGADCVRLKTLKGVLDVLTPLQCVEFLAAFLTLQLRLRQWGKKKTTDMIHVARFNER